MIAPAQSHDVELLAFVDVYAESRRVAPATVKSLRQPVRSLSRMLGRKVQLAELDKSLIERWTDWRREQGARETTLRAQRGFLFALWRLASEMGLAATAPPAWFRTKRYSVMGVTRVQLLRRVEENPKMTAEDVRLCLAFFSVRDVRLPALAEQMGISYSYLNAVAYKSKPVTPQFRNRIRGLLIEAKGASHTARGRRRRKRNAITPERHTRLSYPELVESIAKPTWTAVDVWAVVNYCLDNDVTRRSTAAALGVSYDHLNAVLYSGRKIGGQLRERFRRLLSKPLTYHASLEPGEPLAPTKRHPGKSFPVCSDPVPAPTGIELSEYLKDYLLAREISGQHAKGLAAAVRIYGAFLGRPATIGDLQPRPVNQWLVALTATGQKAATVRSYRQRIVALWNAAYRDEPPLLEIPPLRVRPIKRDRAMPDAWSLDEIRALFKQPDSYRGAFPVSRVSRCGYWRAFILLAYNTGLRLGDLERLRFDGIGTGMFSVTQRKSGKPIMCALWPETMEAIAAIAKPKRDRILGGVIGRQAFYRRFKELTEAAGLRGTWRKIRRTSGTLVESIAPGFGHQHLGNGSDVFLRHYLDQRHLTRLAPQPPRLVEGGAIDHNPT